jgi:hypothetical protein
MEPYEDQLPGDLQAIARRLRAERDRFREERGEADAVLLDQIKLQALSGVSRGPRPGKGRVMTSRLATLLTVGLLTIGVGGTIALANDGNGSGSAAKTQYCDDNGARDHGASQSNGDEGEDNECQEENEGGDHGDHG